MLVAYLHGHNVNKDGTKDTFWTRKVKTKRVCMVRPQGPKHRIPSVDMVLFNGRWRRVYLDMRKPTQYGAYIGHVNVTGERICVQFPIEV